MREIVIRFFIGGAVVSGFAVISDLLKPKSFAGLFGAAPSVALASLVLCALTQPRINAVLEARSMMLGAVALFVYALAVSYLLLRFKVAALPVALSALLLWTGVAVGLWYAVLGH